MKRARLQEKVIAEAIGIRELCHRYNVPLIINDNVDVALKSGADGVHVGIEDTPVVEIRRRVLAGFIIGATCKTVEQARTAEAAGTDYMGVGAVFPSPTKANAIAGLLIVLFSTVTTTFLDAYSAGVSSESLSARISGKWVAVGVTVLGILGAVFLPLADITDFLYFIGSVFAPMIAVQIADFFILKQNRESSAFSVRNLVIWLAGFVIYRLLMNVDIIVGNTLPDMIITIILCVAVSKMTKTKNCA